MKKTIFYTDAKGNQIPIEVKINKDLDKKSKKKSKLKTALAATAIVLSIGTAATMIGHSIGARENSANSTNPTTSTTPTTLDENDKSTENLRFDPNSKESIIDNAVLLIGEAAKCGKELDAEDAVLAVIAANSNELSAGFMGELFGEKADQIYTYSSIVDVYLRVCMMQNENVGIAKDDEIAFNIENIFANQEDYNFLCQIRELTTCFNNSTDKNEKDEIANQLNQIAANLCGYDVYDISNTAGIVAMLTLDGMRTVTVATDNPILPADIRDEMFGNGDYACTKGGSFSTTDGQVLQTAYSLRVGDLKLDTIETKLDNAVLIQGKTVILDEIIKQVEEKTKDIEIADIDIAEEINKKAEENRDITYEYESTPGTVKDNYSEKTDKDVVQSIGGQDVIVVDEEKTSDNSSDKNNSNNHSQEANQTTEPATPENPEVAAPNTELTTPTEPTTPENPEVATPSTELTTPTEPEITVEENVIPEQGEEIFDNKEEAEEQLRNEWEIAQADSNQGSIDGEYYGKNGLDKPSFEGKSEFYINAFNPNYEFWYNKYLQSQPTATSESYNLDNLSKEQLEELKNAAMGEEEYTQTEDKTK